MDKQPEYKNVKARISESMLLHIRVHESEDARDQDIVYAAMESGGYPDPRRKLSICQILYARLGLRGMLTSNKTASYKI